MKFVTGNEATLLNYQALCSKAVGCPRVATNVGSGVHVAPAESAGMRFDDLIEHPSTSGLFRHRALDPAHELYDAELLTAQEQADVQSAWDSAAPLDPSWSS